MGEFTLGNLCSIHLGLEISFQDGGATYTGVLDSVDHKRSWGGQPPKTFVVIEAGSWRHVKACPSDTRCEVLWTDEQLDAVVQS